MGRRASLLDQCRCTFEGDLTMNCHQNTPERVAQQYGASWWVPIDGKQMDSPGFLHKETKGYMKGTDNAIRALDKDKNGIISHAELENEPTSKSKSVSQLMICTATSHLTSVLRVLNICEQEKFNSLKCEQAGAPIRHEWPIPAAWWTVGNWRRAHNECAHLTANDIVARDFLSRLLPPF
jgi:hypothetical protein